MIDDPIELKIESQPVESDQQEGYLRPEVLLEAPTANSANFERMLVKLEREIGYTFRNSDLLRRALTHRSFANEQSDPRPMHNEALEFLGDAVLEFLISAWLLELFPTHNEGTLSKMRAYAVSALNLQKHASRLSIGNYLLINRGEEKTGGRTKTALQVDAYEALIAAIYLDGGIDCARDFVMREFVTTFAEIDPEDLTSMDYKTALQEKLQSDGLPTPQYAIVESLGPDHRRVFQIELRVSGYCLATGEGTTIKGAHQAAARAALLNLDQNMTRLKEIQEMAQSRNDAAPIEDRPEAVPIEDGTLPDEPA
ncbi:MAG: ribonuclease III [Acidobacteria bacterium]|nr:ribonuclease III [Acidobacteriota bacterium]